MRALVVVAAVVACLSGAGPAFAQQFVFDNFFDATGVANVDIATIRGTISVVAGEADRVRVVATVRVHVDRNTPANASDLAQQVAKAPPIERDGATIRLRPPTDSAQSRAVTVSYEVRVPAGLAVQTRSDSGDTTVRDTSGPVRVRTESAAITVDSLKGAIALTTGSGAVSASDVSGATEVTTGSGGLSARRIAGSLHVRTDSGEVDAELSGEGDVDVESGSSAIKVRGVRGGLVATTQSGRVTLDAVPQKPWTVTTGSSGVEIAILRPTDLSLDADSRSGDVTIEGGNLKGSVTKHAVRGNVGNGGPVLRVRTDSGAIRIRFPQ